MSILSDLLDPEVQKNIMKGYNWVKELKPKDDPFSDISESLLFDFVIKSSSILLDDRLVDGPGQGGWGRSDKIFVGEIFGKDAANRIEDSVTITVNTIIALRSFVSYLRRSNSSDARKSLRQVCDIIYDDEYIEKRWDSKQGSGGKLCYSRNNDFHLATCYRHTAVLLKLWLEDDRYSGKVSKTYEYLIENFERLDWKKEKVDTAVLTYVAFKMTLEHPQQSKLLDLKKVPIFLKNLETIILSKYDVELDGWTCEPQSTPENIKTRQISRQPYTLFVLAEMANYLDVGEDLLSTMKRSLEETINGKWKVNNRMYGFIKLPSGKADFTLSCMGASVLLRKAKKSNSEMDYLRRTIDFVVKCLENNPGIAQGAYLWPLSYFIKDVCDYLRKSIN